MEPEELSLAYEEDINPIAKRHLISGLINLLTYVSQAQTKSIAPNIHEPDSLAIFNSGLVRPN